MNTPAHLIVAAAVFAKPNNPRVTWTAIIGGFLPHARVLIAGIAAMQLLPAIIFGFMFSQ